MTKRFDLLSVLIQSTSRFRRDAKGSLSVELVIVMPLLLWALAATVVFYDGFRNRYHAQMAAQTVADIMSRETDLFTADYVEGLNNVFDFLADSRYPTRIRVSSVIWDSTNERNRLQWSYGTRGLAPLPADTFELLQANDIETLLGRFGEDESFSFAGAAAQMPVEDLASRIPPVLPGEALLMVETFALWTPFSSVGVGQMRFAPVVVVRPRFAPWINFDGVDPVYPEDDYEILWTGGGGNDTLPDPNDPDTPDDTGDTNVAAFNFDTGVTTNWNTTTVTSGGPTNSYLGPFDGSTRQNPITLNVDLGSEPETATIEFDLLVIDSWDGYSTQWASGWGDTFRIMIDGSPITLDAFDGSASGLYGRAREASAYVDGALYRIAMTPTRTGSNFMRSSYNDQVWHVTMTISRPPQTFRLGFASSTNSPISDESWGLDNLTITASGARNRSAYFAPIGYVYADTYTDFAQYSGTPEFRIPAPWLTMNNDDLRSDMTILRRAGGETSLRNNGVTPGWGYSNASPSLVLNYDNQGRSGAGNQLAILMDDGNSGYSCDTTLLVRDPNGQWYFNDDISGWNAGLRMGNAPSGTYVIWIGTYSYGRCDSRIRFDNY